MTIGDLQNQPEIILRQHGAEQGSELGVSYLIQNGWRRWC